MASQQGIPFVDLKAQYQAIQGEVDRAMAGVLQSTAFILGPDVSAFEKEFAAYCQTEYAVGVDSGTTALELILRGYDIGPGDEVITQANTFIATTLAATHTGAKPVLVDIDPKTYNIDVKKLEKAITPHTKAIMPVHLYGRPADMTPIMEIARKHSLIVVEDACQAHGAFYDGKRVGSFGNAAAFSFYPAKNLGAYGDGGMIVTSDKKLYEKLLKLREYGQSAKYYHDIIGFNRRLDTIQAAVLRVKLKYLDGWNQSRQKSAALYNRLLAGTSVITPDIDTKAQSIWHLYVVRVKNRDALRTKLGENGVSTGIHYPVPIHLQKAYQSLGYKEGDFPITEAYSNEILSLPMYPELTSEQVETVVKRIKELI